MLENEVSTYSIDHSRPDRIAWIRKMIDEIDRSRPDGQIVEVLRALVDFIERDRP
jgi:hypothetical protein